MLIAIFVRINGVWRYEGLAGSREEDIDLVVRSIEAEMETTKDTPFVTETYKLVELES